MRRYLPVAALLLAWAATAHARGLLIPEDKSVPPLAMLNHKVTIAIEDQVAVTRVEQTFRNHTDRPLEATYVFPLPKGASLDHFSMWVDGKEVKGEIIEAAKRARGLHRHRSTHAGPRTARVPRQQPGPAQGLPDPRPRRSENRA